MRVDELQDVALLQGNLHGKSEKKILRYNSLPPNQNILAGVQWGKSPSINGTYYLGERQVFKHNELSCFSTRAQEQSKS